ncbi:MAG: hypothetical protein H0V17_01295 [Deltaproteobacteria bacterium]|nr:hypothetical protein [Deltaproteobacteria bacterium]
MKKCASCTKDLPDAALHCVFCGAKQPPAPAVAGSAAKTVMGHASNEMIEQLKAAAAQAARQQPNNMPAPAPAPAPYMAPPPQHAPAPAPYTPPHQAPRPAPSPAMPGAGSVAPTMFVPGGGPPMGGPGAGHGPGPGPNLAGAAPTMMAGPGGLPPGPTPGPSMGMPPGPGMGMPPGPGPGIGAAPIPTASTPYTGARTTARAGRPIEPWKDSLRLMMILGGAALLVAFMVPTSTEPSFMFQQIIDGEGVQKLGPLLIAAIGLLALVLSFIPMSPSPRGLIAGLLGLCGILIPTVLALSKGDFGMGQIMVLIAIVGVLTLIPGLLLRSEYRDSIMPRIMVTIGALCILVPELIPNDAGIPLVNAFTGLIDAEGAGKVKVIIRLVPTLLAIISLLAWLPAPSSGASFVLAWLFIAWHAISHFTELLVRGHIGDVVSASPYAALASWIPLTAYLILTGYGLATVLGKKLE